MMTYHFSSMNSLADYFFNYAASRRLMADKAKGTRKIELLAEAAAHESVAFMLRSTVIDRS